MAKVLDGKSIGKKSKKQKIVEAPAKGDQKKKKIKTEAPAAPAEVRISGRPLAPMRQSSLYTSRVDALDKTLQLNSSLERQPTISTGLLALDWVLGRGYSPGFNVLFGSEGSAKSTAAMTALGSSLRIDVPFRKYFDAEGAVDRTYTSQVIRTDDFTAVFGDRGRDGKWVIEPMCRYHDTNIIEKVFRSIHRAASMMPDKVYRQSDEMWYHVFERDQEQTKLLKEHMKFFEAEPIKKLYTESGRYWLPIGAESDAPQGVVLIDSIPSLIPERIDEEEISDRAMAIEARTLGPMLKLIRGKLRPKGLIVLAVNQLRSNPGARQGQPDWYEPGGNTLKFVSDTRNMFTSRVPLDGFSKDKDAGGMICGEPSVEVDGAIDYYMFKGITNVKNKLGTPMRKSASRVWIKDGYGNARGFCPAYDTYKFLSTLDLIEGPIHDSRRSFRIKLKKLSEVEFKWESFKTWILAQEYNNSKLRAKAKEMGMPTSVDIRQLCLNMIRSGRSEELYAKAQIKRQARSNSVDLEAESDSE